MKNIILFIACVLSSLTVYGQRIAFSVELGGITSRDMRFELTNTDNYRYSYFTGVGVLLSPNNKTSFITGIHYLRQGYQHATCYIVEPGTNSNLIGKVDQITIPFTVRKSLFKSDKFFAEFGLYGGYNVKAFADVPEAIGGCELGYVTDLKPMTTSWSMGSIAGLEFAFYQKHNVQIGTMLRYYQGLSNSVTSDFQPIMSKPIQRRSSLTLSLFFRFDGYNNKE